MAMQHGLLYGTLVAAFEGGISALLNLNPNKTALLAPLAGKMIALRLEPFGGLLYLCVTVEDIKILTESSVAADVSLTGTIAAFASLSLSRESRLDPLANGLMLDGDPTLADAVLNLLAHIDLDRTPAVLSGHFPIRTPQSTVVSEPAFNPLSGWLEAGMGWSGTVARTLRQNLAEYWQEESRELPSEAEVSAFFQDVTDLQQATDQFEQDFARRIERLMTRKGKIKA